MEPESTASAGSSLTSPPISKDPDNLKRTFGQSETADTVFAEYLGIKFKNSRKPVHDCLETVWQGYKDRLDFVRQYQEIDKALLEEILSALTQELHGLGDGLGARCDNLQPSLSVWLFSRKYKSRNRQRGGKKQAAGEGGNRVSLLAIKNLVQTLKQSSS